MKKIKYIFLFTLLCGFLTNGYSQEEKVGNLPKYYHERLHFGFTIGLNTSDFIVHHISSKYLSDSLKSVLSIPDKGFNLGIIAELRLHEYFTLRFVPDLSFASRTLTYHFEGQDTTDRTQLIESTFIDFPIDLKLRSKRLNNFSAYLLGGGKYSIDLASQKNVKNAPGQEIVKLEKNDFGFGVGAGVEFYLPYFKFAIEGKLSVGAKNLLIKDNTELSNSIEKLNSKIFLISFTFEGG